jgi:hypothetical protein
MDYCVFTPGALVCNIRSYFEAPIIDQTDGLSIPDLA